MIEPRMRNKLYLKHKGFKRKLESQYLGVPIPHNHEFDPNCPTCGFENRPEEFGHEAALHGGDIGVGKSVIVGDAVHHGSGILVPLPREYDYMRHAPDEDDIRQAMVHAEHEAASAELKAKEKELAEIKLEKELEERKAHMMKHQKEYLEKVHHNIAKDKLKTHEIYGKTVPQVYVFPTDDTPMYHHAALISEGIQAIRNADRANIEAAQNAAKLHDITGALKSVNPHITDPRDYKNLVIPESMLNSGLVIPTSTSNGNFYLDGSSPLNLGHPEEDFLGPPGHYAHPHDVPDPVEHVGDYQDLYPTGTHHSPSDNPMDFLGI